MKKLYRPLVILTLLTVTPIRAEIQPVQVVAFEAPSVGRSMKYQILLPEGYDGSEERYPVLYLLHGLTSNYKAWPNIGVPLYAQFYDLIVVFPDAGNSWYVNWAESEGGAKDNWEDYIIEDVIGHVDANYRTIAQREGRAINGLSMGGFGAIMLGLRHHEMFASIGSHSGAIGFARRNRESVASGQYRSGRSPNHNKFEDPAIGIPDYSSQFQRTPDGKIFASIEDCDANDPFKLIFQVPRDELPHIYIDCGFQDGLFDSNLDFVDMLIENQIPFTYAQSPGGHNPLYWAREVGHSIAVQYHIMQRELGPQRVELRRVSREERYSENRPPQAPERSTAEAAPEQPWPPYQQELAGENQVRLMNHNVFPIIVGLRSGVGGRDFIVESGSEGGVGVPDGDYQFFLKPVAWPAGYLQGQSFTLEGQGLAIEIHELPPEAMSKPQQP